jgi:hypothetical protein
VISKFSSGIDFSFGIIFEKSEYLLADINKDGLVDIFDVVIVTSAYGASQGSVHWNPDADLNKDGHIDTYDVVLVLRDYGKPL